MWTKSAKTLMGPLLLFDKSLLHVLNADEIKELSRSFLLVGSPTLVREIIGDLRHPDAPLPEERVRALARKMGRGHAYHSAHYQKLALHNLSCGFVPMEGRVPIDVDAPNVELINGGEGVIYDRAPEQRVWDRWALGDFNTRDDDAAIAWRKNIERVNLKAVGAEWKSWVGRHLGDAKTIPEIVKAVDSLAARYDRDIQRELLSILLRLLRAPTDLDFPPLKTFLRHGIRLQTIAPYAASILRLYLTFIAGIARGRIGARKTHTIDLQYLFYAPFCMVFASDDNFHETLWPAVSGKNMLVKAAALKMDLARRIQLRKGGVQTFQSGYPVALENSVISDAMDHAFGTGWRRRLERQDEGDDMKPGTRIDDLPAIHRDRIKAAFKKVDLMPKDEADLF